MIFVMRYCFFQILKECFDYFFIYKVYNVITFRLVWDTKKKKKPLNDNVYVY